MSRTTRIAARVARGLGLPGAEQALSGASASRLRSLLMHVMRERARTTTAAALGNAHARGAVFAPSAVSQKSFHRMDGRAFAAAGEAFEAVELSPICPLGTNAVLGGIDQNNVLSTIAGSEVTADPTSAMGYLCAQRRLARLARDPRDALPVAMCTSHRMVRLQPMDVPGFTPHFRLFALATAGRDRGAERFELDALREHLGVYLRLLRALAVEGFDVGDVEVEVSDPRLTLRLARELGFDLESVLASVRAHVPADHAALFRRHGVELPQLVLDPRRELSALDRRYGLGRELARLERLRRDVLEPLGGEHPGVRFGFGPMRLVGLRYYVSYSFRVFVGPREAGRAATADGGFTTWTARFMSNRKERFLASGIGTEYLCKLTAARA